MKFDFEKNVKDRYFGESLTQILIMAVFSIVIIIMLGVSYLNLTFFPSEGRISPKTIISPVDKTFQTESDIRKTEEYRNERAGLVQDIYTVDKNIIETVRSDVVQLFTIIRKLKIGEITPEAMVAQTGISENVILTLQKEDLRNLSLIEQFVLNIIERLMSEGIVSIEDETVTREISTILNRLQMTADSRNSIRMLINGMLKPNKIADRQKTDLAKLQARESVEPFTTEVRAGQAIIYRGDAISREQIEILKKLNLFGLKIDFSNLVIIIIICLLLFGSCIFGLQQLQKDLFKDPGKTVLIGLFFLLILFLARAFEPVSGYLVPIPMAGILLSILLNPLLALYVVVHLSIMTGVLYNFDMGLFYVLLFSSVISIYTVRNATQRGTITKTGLEICIVNIVLITLLGIYKHESTGIILTKWIWGIVNGAGSSILSLGLIPVLEHLFKIITPMRLVELANPSQPLLKKLMVEAPGTYQHSLMVANLAEAAAESIGANALLVRVGSYYHDIGKIKRPSFFIENQRWAGNPHDKIDPKLSTLIITSHPKDGLALLKEYRMPEFLNDFVLEHHGTGLVGYFYRQMINQKEQGIDEHQFRYEGPKPQSKETAILMLADSVEAAVRALGKTTHTKIENVIAKIFQEKCDDNQFENTPLTFADISLIKNTFIETLSSAYHKRIEYPEHEKDHQEK
ncbi:MAG: HDIG domain-containing metalloprotein [Candidatus Margulisiibacteriota bacterium]